MIRPTIVQFAAYLNGVWTDLSEYFISCTGRYGMKSASPNDRIADIGALEVVLKNTNGEFIPGTTYAIDGWKKGIIAVIQISYDGQTYVKWNGWIDKIRFDAGTKGPRKAYVTVLDWIRFLNTQPISQNQAVYNTTADNALLLTIGDMTQYPFSFDIDTGVNNFPSVFDMGNADTKAMTEISRIVNSEMGYLYERKGKTTGSTLRFENFTARNGLVPVTTYPIASLSAVDELLLETGDSLLAEDGGTMMLEATTSFYADNNMMGTSITYGDRQVNNAKVVAYTRIAASSPEALYTMAVPQWLGVARPLTFRVNYTDPETGSRVAVDPLNMIAPVATTDYAVNRYADGSSTDMTGSITVNVTYYSTYADVSITNGLDYAGYITIFQLRGYKTVTSGTMEGSEQHADSITDYGYQPLDMYQQYQHTTDAGIGYARSLVALENQPRRALNKVTFSANASADNMQAFLNLDIGDKFGLSEDLTELGYNYYIQGVEFSIHDGGLIEFSYITKESRSMLDGNMGIVFVQFGATTDDALNYGFLPQLQGMSKRSVSMWIYRTAGATFSYLLMLDGLELFIDSSGRLHMYQYKAPGGKNEWYEADTITLDTWHHIVLTHDMSSSVMTAPVMYIDGTSRTITAVGVGSGTFETGITDPMIVGNSSQTAYEFLGNMADLRVYNKILSAAEVTTLNGDGVYGVGVTDGMKFHGFTIPIELSGVYDGRTLVDGDYLFEDYNMAACIPSGEPQTSV